MSSKTDLAIGVTLVVAVVLRLAGLGSPLWYDEIVTLVESVRQPIGSILTTLPGVNAHPLYSVLAHVSVTTLGESAWTLRLPAAMFGVASVAMVYVLGARIIGRPEAWAGATALAVSYHHIWFSQNARGYTLIGFFALVSTWCLLRAGRGAGRSTHVATYVVYALAAAAGVYTHLSMALVVAGHVAVVLGGRIVRWKPAADLPVAPLLAAWASAVVLAVIAYAPFMSGLMAELGADAPREAAKVATGSWAVAEALRSVLSGSGVAAALAGGIVAAIGALSLARRAPLPFALLVVPAIVTAAAIVVLGWPMRPRFFFFLSGAAAIFIGRGLGVVVRSGSRVLGRQPRRSRNGEGGSAGSVGAGAPFSRGLVVATLVLAATFAATLPRNYRVPKQNFDAAVAFLESEESAGVSIAAVGPACYPIEKYFLKAGWPCLNTSGDLGRLRTRSTSVRIVYTLADYISDPALQREVRETCREIRRFPATLGGGDVVICQPPSQGAG